MHSVLSFDFTSNTQPSAQAVTPPTTPATAEAAVQSTALLSVGDVVDGRYRIDALLGSGGMAAVYRARHLLLDQDVAIKIIAPQIREVPGVVQRFLREARAATRLKSGHVAHVTDVGVMPDGAPYMVMELLEGRDLDTVIETTEEIPVEEAVDYMLQACEALAEVHGLGIVHRDLKPANLFVTPGADGLPLVKLIDFGISRVDAPLSENDRVAQTLPGALMGSPRYMSPEQLQSATNADMRSDIYGLGAVLYELLTRRTPYEGETLLDLYTGSLTPPMPPTTWRNDVPSELDEVILRCLSVEPAGRYGDVAELAVALAPFGPRGSMQRADSIGRILAASRLRTKGPGAADASVRNVDDVLRARRRVPSSAYAVLQRRLRWLGTTLALVVFCLVSFGGRVLYVRHVGAEPQPSVEVVSAPQLASAPTVVVPPVDAVTSTTTAAVHAPSGGVLLNDEPPRPIATVAEDEKVPQPAAVVEAPPTPAPAPAPVTATVVDERKLFEERK